MAKIRIRDYLKDKNKIKKISFQVRIDKDLFTEARKKKDKENITWPRLIEAALRKFLDE